MATMTKLFTTTKFHNLEELLVEQIQDLYDAEKRLCDTLPKMAKAATSRELQSAFQTHLEETKGHVHRLEQVFNMLSQEANRETCDAMKGLIKEGEEMIDAKGDNAVRDAALIAAAQRVEHYEIAGYGTARTFAKQIGRQDIAEVLDQTLSEERHADELLTQIAQRTVNPAARS